MFSVILPIYYVAASYIRKRPLPLPVSLHRIGLGTFVGGSAFGAAAGAGRMKGMSEDEVSDRAFRLRHNLSQQHTDDFAYRGMAAGGTVGALAMARFGARVAFPLAGAAFGSLAGIVAHLAVFQGDATPTAMLEEAKAAFPVKQAVDRAA